MAMVVLRGGEAYATAPSVTNSNKLQWCECRESGGDVGTLGYTRLSGRNTRSIGTAQRSRHDDTASANDVYGSTGCSAPRVPGPQT